jgi:hypothetical protein
LAGGAAAVLIVVLLVLPTVYPATALGLHFQQGASAPYAYGSCAYYQFTLDKPALVTGAFSTNGSAVFLVTQGADSYPSSQGCLSIPSAYYSTGSVHEQAVNFTLAPGTYVIAFAFTSQAGASTQLSITKSFVATYMNGFVDEGPSCVSISCYRNHLGPEGPSGQT